MDGVDERGRADGWAVGVGMRHPAAMEHVPSPRELRTAARACVVLAYAAGLAGVAAGTLVLRDGDLAFAIILWTVTFAIGASLMGVAVVIRAVAGLVTQVTRLESDVRVLLSDRARTGWSDAPDPDPDPGRWLGH
jgi:hypothetical protein